jgi:hypothetical protein
MVGTARRARLRIDADTKSAPRIRFSFIFFIDAIFTTLLERPFTNVFEVIAENPAIS